MGLGLHVLYLGKMEFPKFRLVDWKDENEMVVSPAVSLLIQHPTLGNILYDTGNSEHFAELYSEEMLHNYPVTECITIEEALAETGVQENDRVTVTPARIKKLESRSFKTESGIEIRIPAELCSSDDAVEFIHSATGGLSLLIKDVLV